MKNLAVIPARGGSKRIPRKNIRLFAGRPIIEYSIAAARESGLFGHIFVSTDDSEIARLTKRLGAEVPFKRPSELADDFTDTHAVVKHAITWATDSGIEIDNVCCLYATAPLLKVKYLREGYEKLINSGKAYAFSVTRFEYPIQRAIRLSTEGTVEPFFPQFVPARSQDLEQAYHDAGQFYWGTIEAFLGDVPVFSSASLPVVLPRQDTLDIDTPEDWVQAEVMYRAWKDRNSIR